MDYRICDTPMVGSITCQNCKYYKGSKGFFVNCGYPEAGKE